VLTVENEETSPRQTLNQTKAGNPIFASKEL